MLHGVEITIRQMVGRQKGVIVTLPQDVIYATRNGNTCKLGFVGRHEGARCLFIRHLTIEERDILRSERSEAQYGVGHIRGQDLRRHHRQRYVGKPGAGPVIDLDRQVERPRDAGDAIQQPGDLI